MLRKLFAFEMKEMGRTLLPLCLAAVLLSVVLGISLSRMQMQPVVNAILVGLLFLVLFASALATFVLVLTRFSRNLLGDEGYFMFSIPATTAQQIHAKGLASTLWTAMVGATACVSGVLLVTLGMMPETRQVMGPYLKILRRSIEEGTGRVMLSVCLLCLCWAAAVIYKFYAAMALGHVWRGHRRIGTILALIGFEIVQSQVSRLVFRFYPEIEDAMPATWSTAILSYAAYMLVLAGIYSLVAWFLLDRKLNLE